MTQEDYDISEEKPKNKKNKQITRIIIIIILIIILLFSFVWAGYIRCSKIPGMCQIYWGIQTFVTGIQQPNILILYDPTDINGLGNPYLLQKALTENISGGYHPQLKPITYFSKDTLQGVSLVIVDKARKISTTKLETLMDYVQTGGRLIWIGDAGVELEEQNERYATVQDITEDSNDTTQLGNWARVNGDWVLRFDEFLGVKYITNYCNLKECKTKEYEIPNGAKIKIKNPEQINGNLVANTSNSLTYGLKEYLPNNNDFAIVETLSAGYEAPLKLDYGTKLFSENYNGGLGPVFPLIVISNNKKVIYYAIPPEYFIEPEDKDKYYSIIENMLDGILK